VSTRVGSSKREQGAHSSTNWHEHGSERGSYSDSALGVGKYGVKESPVGKGS